MRHEASEWERKAEIALSKDRDDLARAALKEKTESLTGVSAIDLDLEQIEHNLQKLSGDIGQLQQKLTDAKARQKALIMRGQTVQSRMGVKRQLHDVDVEEAMGRFDRYERRIDELEGEVEAYDLGQRSLADEIAELEADEEVDAELAKLKQKMHGTHTSSQSAGE
jgi:phage shock protein A